MKVSVVTVCLNAVKEIETTILSVLNQSYTDVEYIVVDGGSTDGTKDIIYKYKHRIAHYISEPDKGIYDAMNKGIDLATGAWINFMNAGDCFVNENVIANVVPALQDGHDVVFGNTIMVNGRQMKLSKGQLYPDRFPKIGHQSSFVKTSLMKENHFNTKYIISADYDFLYKLYKEGKRFFYIDTEIAMYNMDGTSSNHRELLYQEHCEIKSQNPSWKKLIKYRIEDNMPIRLMKWLLKFKREDLF